MRDFCSSDKRPLGVLNARNLNDRIVLRVACGVGEEQVAMALLDARADPSIPTFDKKNAVWLTAKDVLRNSNKRFSRQCYDRL